MTPPDSGERDFARLLNETKDGIDAGIAEIEALSKPPAVAISLDLAQRILAALEDMPSHRAARALAAELRERMPK